jgi:4-hydroxy-tetrahydrodipicolinate reductase
VVIEFTSPASTIAHNSLAAQGKTAHIIGTTGLDSAQEAALARAAHHTPIVYAANFSVGVNLLLALTRKLATCLDHNYDIEIIEMHHRDKVDAPSGTALALGHAAAAGRGGELSQMAQINRQGARPPGSIGFASLRGGDVVGEHEVIFASQKERISLVHKASHRGIFAQGAVKAALWAVQQPPGLYHMQDIFPL